MGGLLSLVRQQTEGGDGGVYLIGSALVVEGEEMVVLVLSIVGSKAWELGVGLGDKDKDGFKTMCEGDQISEGNESNNHLTNPSQEQQLRLIMIRTQMEHVRGSDEVSSSKKLQAMGFAQSVLTDAYLYLIENPDKRRAFIGCLLEGRKDLLERMMYGYGSFMDMSVGRFSNRTGKMDFNIEGHSRWHEPVTTNTDNECKYNPNDTCNNNEWPFHVPFAHGNVSTDPKLCNANLVQPADDLLHSELITLQDKDMMGKEFISVTDAEEFYTQYSYGMGFSTRKDRLCRDTHGLITVRRWVCSKEGYRSKKHVDITDRVREPRGKTREGCRASFKINFDREKMFKKDLQNRVDTIRRSASHNSDADSLISYMTAESEMDPGFFFRYTILADGSMGNLFWSDAMSRCNYSYFGDVMSFDSTYRTNSYNRPLVILVGVNNHMKTIIFGFGLLVDETVETYSWILQTFLQAMHGKCPVSVVTNGDKAMSKALSSVMLSTIRRLCSWHLERNVQTNVGDTGFTQAFTDCMLTYMTESEFETQWLKAIETFGLQRNDWVKMMYCKRKLWAETFLRGTFFGGLRSTQRSESINSFLNKFLHRRLKFYDFMSIIDRAMSRL
ncbi:hypothetical protein LWI29_013012 [Acer saccharum]|uniref:Protein FAR1-RELATED SEQUENCE n=1 Tax=Acer saccharum TaxID=4024 RepID=A0AA39RWD7_ACESA|nr:hypothetical protein LWI29_013012 [Acer saccharum]